MRVAAHRAVLEQGRHAIEIPGGDEIAVRLHQRRDVVVRVRHRVLTVAESGRRRAITSESFYSVGSRATLDDRDPSSLAARPRGAIKAGERAKKPQGIARI